MINAICHHRCTFLLKAQQPPPAANKFMNTSSGIVECPRSTFKPQHAPTQIAENSRQCHALSTANEPQQTRIRNKQWPFSKPMRGKKLKNRSDCQTEIQEELHQGRNHVEDKAKMKYPTQMPERMKEQTQLISCDKYILATSVHILTEGPATSSGIQKVHKCPPPNGIVKRPRSAPVLEIVQITLANTNSGTSALLLWTCGVWSVALLVGEGEVAKFPCSSATTFGSNSPASPQASPMML